MDLTRCGSARRCGMCDLSSAEVSLSRARKYKNIEFRSLEEPMVRQRTAVYVLQLPTMWFLDLLLPTLQLFGTDSIIVLGMDTLRSKHTIRKTKIRGYLFGPSQCVGDARQKNPWERGDSTLYLELASVKSYWGYELQSLHQ
jgi:hypothetical protein